MYPYYAGFSQGFARTALAPVPRDGLVLDPWNGSGTTTLAAAREGLAAVGSDLNPFALMVSTAKLIDEGTARDVLDRCRRLREPRSSTDDVRGDALSLWFSADVVRAFRAIERACADVADKVTATRPAGASSASTAEAMLIVALVRAARPLAVPATLSNPTWARPRRKKRGTAADLFARFQDQLTSLRAVCADFLSAPPTAIRLLAADARLLPLPSASVDAVVTSPPYCTRIDYAVTTSFELAALSGGTWGKDDFRHLREQLMGTTVVRRDDATDIRAHWPGAVQALLAEIHAHRSHGSRRYYYRNLRQYFDDADRSFAEIARVLKNRGTCIVVAQTSFYKEIEIDLPRLLADVAREHGLAGSIIASSAVWPVMANLNSGAKKHLKRRSYNEAVLRLEKR